MAITYQGKIASISELSTNIRMIVSITIQKVDNGNVLNEWEETISYEAIPEEADLLDDIRDMVDLYRDADENVTSLKHLEGTIVPAS